MKNKIKMIIRIIIPIIVVMIVCLVMLNFFVLPPKVSKNAKRYEYNSSNILKLKSIIVDEDRIIYEFSSLNLFFNWFYVKNNLKDSYEEYLKGYYNVIDQETQQYNLTDYKIVSTITSNYLIVSLKDEIEISSIRCSYNMKKSGEKIFIIISGTDNPKIHKLRGLDEKILYEQRSQFYNLNKRKWDKPQKKEFDKTVKTIK